MTSSLELHSVELRVSNLRHSLNFYTAKVGFSALSVTAERATLATEPEGKPILTLTEDKAAASAPPDAAGLFHAALLLPSRAALGRWLQHAAGAGVAFDGFSDHGVSEAVYLSDPEGNGLEFYCDRPHDRWPRNNAGLAMTTLPLDVSSLLSAGATESGSANLLSGGRWGHLHLRVSNPERSAEFYASALGVSLTQRFGANACFLAADGYHHHLGLNAWGGVRQPQPAGVLGLVEATFTKTHANGETHVRDPDQIALHIVSKE